LTKKLGYEFQHCKGETYQTATGNMQTSLSVKLADVQLPHLSWNRTFTATFKIAPAESGDFGYGVIMGIGMMDELGIDQSRTEKIITWGPDVQVPMVPINYWTDAPLQAICKSAKPNKALLGDQRNEPKEPTDATSVTRKSSSDLFLTTNKPTEASFKKAIYEKPDLVEIVKRNGTKLAPQQQALLLNVLVKNIKVFSRGRGY
jgi:hypothetical protein